MNRHRFAWAWCIGTVLAPFAFAAPAGAQPAPDPALPAWWQLGQCAALDYDYPQLGSCKLDGVTHIRLRVRVPLGLQEPIPSMIEDPHGGLRVHTAWDVTWATAYGGNHMDIPCVKRQQNPGGVWDLFCEVDIPIDTSDLWVPGLYSARLINAWVEFVPFPGVEPAQLVMWQCRGGGVQLPGIERDDLPVTPPADLCSGGAQLLGAEAVLSSAPVSHSPHRGAPAGCISTVLGGCHDAAR